jgi:hypothetical protein
MKIHELLDKGLLSRLAGNFETGYAAGGKVNFVGRLGFKNLDSENSNTSKTKSQLYAEEQKRQDQIKKIEKNYQSALKAFENIPDTNKRKQAEELAKQQRDLALGDLKTQRTESYLREHSTELRELFELALGGGAQSVTPGSRVQTQLPRLAVTPEPAAEAAKTAAETAAKTAAAKANEAAKAAKDAAAKAEAQEKLVLPGAPLNEYSVNFVDNLVTLLRNLVGRANDKGKSSKMSYQALKRMLQKTIGSSVSLNKEMFQELTNSNEQLSKYVTNIGNHGVVLATEVKYKPNKTKSKDKTPKTPKNKKSGVKGAASRGAKYLSRSRNRP